MPDSHLIPYTAGLLEKPAADEEEARQTEEEEHAVKSHRLVTEAIAADMRIDHEYHRQSAHGVNVFYTLFLHCECKNTEKKRNAWPIQ